MSAIDAVRIGAKAADDLPALAKFAEEVLPALGAAGKAGGREVRLGTLDGTVAVGEKGSFLRIGGHSAIYESPGQMQLVSGDGAKLLMREKGPLTFDLPNGTHISQEGQIVTTHLPNGRTIVQEKIAQDNVKMTLDGKELPIGTSLRSLGDGVSFSRERHASSLFLADGTYVGNSTYGFDIFRGARGGAWAGGQADISVSQNYFRHRQPWLILHDPGIENMFSSKFASGNATRGLSVRLGEKIVGVKELGA